MSIRTKYKSLARENKELKSDQAFVASQLAHYVEESIKLDRQLAKSRDYYIDKLEEKVKLKKELEREKHAHLITKVEADKKIRGLKETRENYGNALTFASKTNRVLQAQLEELEGKWYVKAARWFRKYFK